MKLGVGAVLFLVAGSQAFMPQQSSPSSHLAFVSHNIQSQVTATALSATSTLKQLPESAVQVDITAPGDATKAVYDKVCRELSKNIQIPGFRKGAKIPPQVLEQAMAQKGGRNALKAQAITELLAQLIEPTLKEEHNLEPIGQPSLIKSADELAETFEPGKELVLQVKCDVWPDIQWAQDKGEKPYMGLSGSYKRKPFNQEKFDKALSDLLERYAQLSPISDANHQLQMGDACVVNMEGYMATDDDQKGEKLPDAASGDNVEVILGEGRYMTGLVEGLVGAKVGDTKEIRVTFPSALRDKTLAGKKAIFDVTVAEASTRTLPELTDEFAAKVRDGLTAESLREELRKAVDAEDAKEYTPARNAALAKALSEVMDVEIPDTLVTNNAREKFAMMMSEMRAGGVADEEIKKQITPENFLKYKKIVRDDIIRDFKVSMATDEIARMESIDVPDYQVQEQLEQVKQEAAESGEEFDEQLIRGKVEATLQRNAVMDFLAEHSTLDVEYVDDNGEQFDESLLEEIAQQTIEREEASADATVEANAPVAEAAPVVEEEQVPVAEQEEEAPSDPDSMSLEDKAFMALKNAGALDT